MNSGTRAAQCPAFLGLQFPSREHFLVSINGPVCDGPVRHRPEEAPCLPPAPLLSSPWQGWCRQLQNLSLEDTENISNCLSFDLVKALAESLLTKSGGLGSDTPQ